MFNVATCSAALLNTFGGPKNADNNITLARHTAQQACTILISKAACSAALLNNVGVLRELPIAVREAPQPSHNVLLCRAACSAALLNPAALQLIVHAALHKYSTALKSHARNACLSSFFSIS